MGPICLFFVFAVSYTYVCYGFGGFNQNKKQIITKDKWYQLCQGQGNPNADNYEII